MLFSTLLVLTFVPSLVFSAPTARRTRRSTRSCPAVFSDVNPSATQAADNSHPTASTSHKPKPKPTKSASSASSPKQTPPPADSLNGLFPLGQTDKSWSTNSNAKNAIPFTDAAMNTFKDAGLDHPVVAAPDGKKGMKVHYPEGEWGFGHDPAGGFSFYASGPDNVDLTKAKEVTLGYNVWFDKGYEWNKGGKMPGLYGGDSPDESTGCSGGRISAACFSARYMWRRDAQGEMYAYLPPHTDSRFKANGAICDVKPFSTCNEDYGASIGRGSFHWKDGAWNTVAQRVRLNDAGQANGELQVWFNGKSVIHVTGLILRQGDAGRIRGIQAQSFFGGSDSSWASPQDQNTYFADFSVAITELL